jgi:SAM-dependent methyltransferase
MAVLDRVGMVQNPVLHGNVTVWMVVCGFTVILTGFMLDNTNLRILMSAYKGYEISRRWTPSSFGVPSTQQRCYFAAEMAAIPRETAGAPRVLDVGFGNGHFMGWCRGMGWDCDGLELNEELLSRARASGFEVAKTLVELQRAVGDKYYDLVTGFDVLEHIDRGQLVDFLSGLRSALRPSSLLIFRFPNGDNPFALPLQNGDLTHLTAIGHSMLHQVATLAGYRVVAIRSPRLVWRGIGVKRGVQQAVGLPLRWLLGTLIRHLFMGGAPVIFSSNLVVLLQLTPHAECAGAV